MKIAVGLSGGVDSSVAALLLKNSGHDVHCFHMRNWHDTTGLQGDCHWEDDYTIAQIVAKKLDLPLTHVDFSKEYEKDVVDYLFSEYRNGRTPNPDILCNRKVKFGHFLKYVTDLGFDYVATGHWARTIHDKLYRSLNPKKDQSYFLAGLSKEQISKTIFPLQDFTDKDDLRKVAKDNGLVTDDKKDSTGICFVGNVDLPTFLSQRLKPIEGHVRLYDGEVIGKHTGAHFYTVGQRKGLGIGYKYPLYVTEIDVNTNTVWVGPKDMNFKSSFNITDLTWISDDINNLSVQIRHLGESVPCRIDNNVVWLDGEIWAPAPGQFAVFYNNDQVIGNSIIT